MLDVFRRTNKWLIKGLELAVMLVTGILVLDVVLGVFTRYVLDDQISWTEELARMLLIWVSLLGASIGFIRKSHLGVDYFVGLLSKRLQMIGQLVVYLLITVFAAVVLIYGGYRLVYSVLQNGQPSAALKIQWGYVYLAVPISGFFIVMFSIQIMTEIIGELFGKTNQI
jgi:TRAP-type C4-dicarboxylate transport system permease small subunit